MKKRTLFLFLSLFFAGMVGSANDSGVLGESFLGVPPVDESLVNIFYEKDSDLIGPSVALCFSGRFWTVVQLRELYVRLAIIGDERIRSEKIEILRVYLSQGDHKYKEMTQEGFALMLLFNEYEIKPYWFSDLPEWLLFSDSIKPFDFDQDIDQLMDQFIDDKVIAGDGAVKPNKLITPKDADWALAVKKNYSKNYFAFLFSRPKPTQESRFSKLLKLIGVSGVAAFGYKYATFRAATGSRATEDRLSLAQKARIDEDCFRNGPAIALYRLQSAKVSGFVTGETKAWFPDSVASDGALVCPQVSIEAANQPIVILPSGYRCDQDLNLIKAEDSLFQIASPAAGDTSFRMVQRYPRSVSFSEAVVEPMVQRETTRVFSGGEFWIFDQIKTLVDVVVANPGLLDAFVGELFPGVDDMSYEERIERFKNFMLLLFPRKHFSSMFEKEWQKFKEFASIDVKQRELPSIFGTGADSNSLFIWFKRSSWWMLQGLTFCKDKLPIGLFEENQCPLISYDVAYDVCCRLLRSLANGSHPALRPHTFEEVFKKPYILFDDRWRFAQRFAGREFLTKNSIQSAIFGAVDSESVFDAEGYLQDPAKFTASGFEAKDPDSFELKINLLLRGAGLCPFAYVAEWPSDEMLELRFPEGPASEDAPVVMRHETCRLYSDSPAQGRRGRPKVLKNIAEAIESKEGVLGYLTGKCKFVSLEDLRVGDCFKWFIENGTKHRKLRLLSQGDGGTDRLGEEGDILLQKMSIAPASVEWLKGDITAGLDKRQAIMQQFGSDSYVSLSGFFSCFDPKDMNFEGPLRFVIEAKIRSGAVENTTAGSLLTVGDKCRIRVEIKSPIVEQVIGETQARLRASGRLCET